MNGRERVNWETFVVRMRRERADGAWRGEIVHVASRVSARFISLAQAEAFISRYAPGIERQVASAYKEGTDE